MIKRLSPKSQFDLATRDTAQTDEKPSGKPLGLGLQHGAKLYKTGLLLPDDLDQQKWEAVGLELMTVDTGLQWALGDWWAHGDHEYGKRAAIAAKKLPYEFGSLMNLGTVARKVTPSCRNELLSFSHHTAVSKLQPEDQKKWLAKAAKGNWPVSKLRQKLYEAEQRNLDDDPGQQASNWVDNLLTQANAASRSVGLDDEQLKLVNSKAISELVEAAIGAADTWATIAENLKRHQQSRAATDPAPKRKPQVSTRPIMLEAAE